MKGTRQSSALVLSIVAVVLSLAGTAAAGVATISSLTAKQKKQTRGIADGEVAKLAPTLSVKSAGSAGSADTATSAVSAQTAANADQLGGRAPSSFLPGDRVRRVDAVLNGFNNQTAPLVTMGPLTLTMRCFNGLDGQTVAVEASTTASDGSAGYGLSGTRAPAATGGVTNVGASPTTLINRTTGNNPDDAGGGEIVYRDKGTTVALTFRYYVTAMQVSCQVFGAAIQS